MVAAPRTRATRVEQLGHDVASVIELQIENFEVNALFFQPFPNGIGHFLGCLPHRIVDDECFFAALLPAPPLIGLDYSSGVLSPDKTVVGSYHIDVDPHFSNLCEQLLNQGGIEQQDICVVLGGVIEEFGSVDFIVEPLAGCPVLAEAVAGQQQLVFGYI